MAESHAWKTDQERVYRRSTLQEALSEFWRRKSEYLDERDPDKKARLKKTATMEAVGAEYGVKPATLRAFKRSIGGEEVNEHWKRKKGWNPRLYAKSAKKKQ